MRFKLQRTKQIPKELDQGVLYVSEHFQFAAHLCACGCGSKIKTPLGPTEWEFEDGKGGPTLYPSIGNWQQKCQSHYWITDGQIRWAEKWTEEQILYGRRMEEKRRESYFENLDQSRTQKKSLWTRIKEWLGLG